MEMCRLSPAEIPADQPGETVSTEGHRSAEAAKRKARRAAGRAKKAEEGRSDRRLSVSRTPDLRAPSPDAIDYCRSEFAGSRRVDGPVRRQFVSVTEESPGTKSVLRRVIAGGGEVRF